MSIKNLRSWQISSDQEQSFYPLGIQCIGVDNEWAISTFAHHTVNTQIFRDFSDAITNDKPPHKSYLHASLYPDKIKDVIVGNSESVILLNDGRIMYFTSPKKLTIVEYLSGIKSICCCQNGFAFIKLSDNGQDFFVEIHPDAFQGQPTEVDGRKTYNITFDKIPGFDTTWKQTSFKIKELRINSKENEFFKSIFPDDIDESLDRFLFVSMDKLFCSMHVIGDEHSVNPITQCNSNIVDFWMGKDGNKIFLLLDTGALELLYLKKATNEVTTQTFYFGDEIQAHCMHEDFFAYSTGWQIEYGCFKFSEKSDKYKFDRTPYKLPGVAAMAYLSDLQFVICISENCLFYRISTKPNEEKSSEWIELDEQAQRELRQAKFDLQDLTDTYDSLLAEQRRKQQLIDIIELKSNDELAIKNGDETLKYRFVASCSVTRTPPIQRHNDVFTNIINFENPLPFDRTKSYFVNITISPVTYANEFENDLWHLRCMWLNDERQNEYANIRLENGMLSEPLTFIIHLQEQNLPEFELDIIALCEISKNSTLEIRFEVRIDQQPDYCEMMDIALLNVEENEIDSDKFALVGTAYIPETISMNDIIADKLVPVKPSKKVPSKKIEQSNIFRVYLLGMELTAIHHPEKEMIRLLSNSAHLMHAIKEYIFHKVISKLKALGQTLNVEISQDVLREYRSACNNLNVILNATDIEDKDKEMLKCIRKVREMCVLSTVKK